MDVEILIRKSVNRIKGKCFRSTAVKPAKFGKENYWKGRKNRALQKLSRETYYADPDEFLLPGAAVNRWDMFHKEAIKRENLAIWHEAGRQMAQLGQIDPLGPGWTIAPELQHFYTADFMHQVDLIQRILN